MSRLFKTGGSGYNILKIHQEKIESLVNQGLHSYDNPNIKNVEDKKKKRKAKKKGTGVKLIKGGRSLDVKFLNKKREEEVLKIIEKLYLQRYTCRAITKELEIKGYTTGKRSMYSQEKVKSILINLFRKHKIRII